MRHTRQITTPLGPEYRAILQRELQRRTPEEIGVECGLCVSTITRLASGAGCQTATKRVAVIYLDGLRATP